MKLLDMEREVTHSWSRVQRAVHRDVGHVVSAAVRTVDVSLVRVPLFDALVQRYWPRAVGGQH